MKNPNIEIIKQVVDDAKNNHSIYVDYLYSDRKTKVTNPVIYSFIK